MSDTAATLPLATGVWTLDTNHSGISFTIKHLGLSNVRGRFDRFDATMTIGESLKDVKVKASVDLRSVSTNQPDRDAHLLGTDFFAADAHPTMTFESTGISGSGADYTLEGTLTLNDISRPVNFAVEFNGAEVFPADGKLHSGFSASGEVRRGDFGIDFNMPLGMDKLALGERVKIELEAQFIAPEPS
jgi:polyisoprenoid-binding protein YceI